MPWCELPSKIGEGAPTASPERTVAGEESVKDAGPIDIDVEYSFRDVSEVSLDRETRRLAVVTEGRPVVVEGVDRLYVRSVPWAEADGTVHLNRGRVTVSGNVAAATD